MYSVCAICVRAGLVVSLGKARSGTLQYLVRKFLLKSPITKGRFIHTNYKTASFIDKKALPGMFGY